MKPTHKLILAGFLALAWTAPATAGHFHIVNKMDAKDCPNLADDLYNDLNKAVNDIINSPVGDDIDQKVDKTVTDAGQKTGDVDVEVSIAPSADAYKKMMHDAGTNRSDADMQNWFDNDVAHTDTVGHGDKQKIVIVVFCGGHLRERLAASYGGRTIIHELVHAQLYAMSLRGILPNGYPYKEGGHYGGDVRNGPGDEHNEDFQKEILRLVKLFDDDQEKKAAQQQKTEEKPKTAEPPKTPPKTAPKTADKPKEKPKTADKPKEKQKTKTADQPKKKANAQNNGGVSMPQSDVQFSFGVMGGGGDRRRDDRRDDPPVGGGGGNNNSGFKMR